MYNVIVNGPFMYNVTVNRTLKNNYTLNESLIDNRSPAIRNDRWPELTYDFVSGLVEKKSPGLENEIRLKVLGDPLNYMERNPIMLSAIPEDKFKLLPKSLWALRERQVSLQSPSIQSPSTSDDADQGKDSVIRKVIRLVSEHNEKNGRKWADETIADRQTAIRCATITSIGEMSRNVRLPILFPNTIVREETIT